VPHLVLRVWVHIKGDMAMAKLEEYTDRWIALRDEKWRIEARLEQIKKEIPLLEAWIDGLDRDRFSGRIAVARIPASEIHALQEEEVKP
jgi:hypothetical protein